MTDRAMTKRGDRRRAALLRAATTVFLRHGFEAASLDEIIRLAGGSRSMIYQLFGDKEGLFAAIVAELCETIMAPLAAVAASSQPPAKVLSDFALVYMGRLMDPAGLALYRVVIAEGRRFPRLGARVFAAGPQAAADQLTKYLARETRRGRLRVGDPARAARVFLEMVKGELHTRALFGVGKPPTLSAVQATVRTAVTLFLDGVTAKK